MKRKLSNREILLGSILAVGAVGFYLKGPKDWIFPKSTAEAKVAAVKNVDPKALPPLVEVNLDERPDVRMRKWIRNIFNYSRSPADIQREEDERRKLEKLQK